MDAGMSAPEVQRAMGGLQCSCQQPIPHVKALVAAPGHGVCIPSTPAQRSPSPPTLNRFRMFSSEAPTYLFRTSGPLTTLGSLPLSIMPSCRAISVLPVPVDGAGVFKAHSCAP